MQAMQEQLQSAQGQLDNLLTQLDLNRDEEGNLLERVNKLKEVENRLLVEVSIAAYSPSRLREPLLCSIIPP
jgi:hypothetical protein